MHSDNRSAEAEWLTSPRLSMPIILLFLLMTGNLRTFSSSMCRTALARSSSSRQQWISAVITAFDRLDEQTLGTRPNRSHLAAQREVRDFFTLLQLPINGRARRRAAARVEWFAASDTPLDTGGVLAD